MATEEKSEQKKPLDGELMFAAGILAGSLDNLKGHTVAQGQVKHVVEWLISLAEEPRDETKDD